MSESNSQKLPDGLSGITTDFLRDLQTRTGVILQRAKQVDKDLTKARGQKQEKEEQITILQKVDVLFEHVMDQGLAQSFKLIEDLVSEGLATVYGDKSLRLKVNPRRKYNTYTVEITTENLDENVEGPTEATFGGAVVQIESFLLRIVFLLQMQMVPLLVLDESFNCVSSGYLANLAQLLRETCNRFGLDLLLVTHQKEMEESADQVFRAVDAKDGNGVQIKKV